MADSDMAMQMRCIGCKREQYAPAVLSISNGESGCAWCGFVPPILTVGEYRERIRPARGPVVDNGEGE